MVPVSGIRDANLQNNRKIYRDSHSLKNVNIGKRSLHETPR